MVSPVSASIPRRLRNVCPAENKMLPPDSGWNSDRLMIFADKRHLGTTNGAKAVFQERRLQQWVLEKDNKPCILPEMLKTPLCCCFHHKSQRNVRTNNT